jgi:hypothetical protein
MILLTLRFILIAWLVAAFVFGMALIAGWDTSCADWPHCAAIITDEEIIDYYIRNVMPR